MGGLFGIVSNDDCVSDLFYGTDYHSHLGTRRGGMAVRNPQGIQRSIHNIENSYFRTKFEPELADFRGNDGIGVISDTDPQPLLVASHLGTFGIVTVGKMNNLDELVKKAFERRRSFFDTTGGVVNPTEMVAKLICEEENFEDGIRRHRPPSADPARCCCSPTKGSTRRATAWGAPRWLSAAVRGPWPSVRSPVPSPIWALKRNTSWAPAKSFS